VEIEQPDKPNRPKRAQFGLLAIFVLMTVCAAIAGLTRLIDVPPLLRYVFAGYLIMLAVPLVLRLPGWVRRWVGASAELKRIQGEQERLREWAAQRRREHREASACDNQDEA
jgi:hypothetical protein